MVDLADLGFLILLLNYLAFAAIFLHRFFNPTKWTVWIRESASGYFWIYLFSFLLVPMMIFLPFFILFLPAIVFAVLSLLIIKSQFEKIGKGAIIPFVLYLFSIGQELFRAFSSPAGEEGLVFLFAWYLLGVFVIIIFGTLFAKLLDRLFPVISKEHEKIMKEKYGPKPPYKVVYRGGAVSEYFLTSPSRFAGVGVVYALWMLVKDIVFGLVF